MEPNQDTMGEQGANNANGNSANNVVDAFNASNTPKMDSVPETSNVMTGEMVGNEKPIKENKGGKGMLIGMILLALLAAGGIGFGAWTMMDGNAQKDRLNSQISALQEQNSELMEKLTETPVVEENETVVNVETGNTYKNPVIKSLDADTEYRVYFRSSNLSGDENNPERLAIGAKDGKIESCQVTMSLGGGGFTSNSCVIDGLEGDIYKIVEFGAGHDNSENNVGFIMTDGTVKYMPLYRDVAENNNYSVRGNLAIDGYVMDVVNITVGSSDPNIHAGGYASTVFILNDGSYVKYEKSMIGQ